MLKENKVPEPVQIEYGIYDADINELIVKLKGYNLEDYQKEAIIQHLQWLVLPTHHDPDIYHTESGEVKSGFLSSIVRNIHGCEATFMYAMENSNVDVAIVVPTHEILLKKYFSSSRGFLGKDNKGTSIDYPFNGIIPASCIEYYSNGLIRLKNGSTISGYGLDYFLDLEKGSFNHIWFSDAMSLHDQVGIECILNQANKLCNQVHRNLGSVVKPSYALTDEVGLISYGVQSL